MKEQEKEQEPIIGTNPASPEEISANPVNENEVQTPGSDTQAIDGTKDIKPR